MIYLDHAATTPLHPTVRDAMQPYLQEEYANPSSIHRMGQRARMAMDEARETVAACINADPVEIVFTSGGTESDNLAIRGIAMMPSDGRRHIVTTAIEHEAVIETCKELEAHMGFDISWVQPEPDGIVRVESVADAIRDDTALVSVMYANNEIGTLQPVREIGCLCRDRGVVFHTDAVQAAGAVPIDVSADQVDLLSLSAHKFYGPKGVGALYVRKGLAFWPQQLGGGQERQRRSGTENVPGIVGMATALKISTNLLAKTGDRLARMRDFLFEELQNAIPDMIVNGARYGRLAGNVNVSFPGVSGESLVIALDAQGVMASTGSACSSGSTEPSHVIAALGRSNQAAAEALRLTLGRDTTWKEIRVAAEAVCSTVDRLRAQASHPSPVAALA